MANVAEIRDVYGDNFELISVRSTATLDDGEVVVVGNLSTVEQEGDVYVVTTPTANTAANLAMIVGEEFYQDSLGNRVNVTDKTSITYPAGSVVRAIRPRPGRDFGLSSGTYTGTPVVGQYLIPTANAKTWAAATSVDDTVNFAMEVKAINANIARRGLGYVKGVEVTCVRNELV